MEDRKVMLLSIENKRLVDIVNRKTEMIKVLLSMVEDKYPGLVEMMSTDEALKKEYYFEVEE